MTDDSTEITNSGSLFIVSTPIGNLGDISFRSIEILQSVSIIAAEDTRRTKVLLNHYQVATPLTSYHSYNSAKKTPELISRLQKGQSIALVSDAGTPGVSDPLYHLVRSAVDHGIPVISAPGACAAISALTVSGLPMDRFVFEGFLPVKKRRKKTLETLAEEPRTVVLYESPHRIAKTLKEVYEVFGDRPAVIAREMTKMHEEIIRGSLSELASLNRPHWKGEITLVIGGRPKPGKEN